MATKLIVAIFALPAIFLALMLSADYAVVEVRDADGTRIIVPVPLTLARMALTFAPSEVKYVQVPEIGEYLEYAEQIVAELRKAPDGILVSVEERDQRVLVEKAGDDLAIYVHDGSAKVDVVVPLDAIMGIVDSYDGESFDTRDLLRAVGRAGGDLVHVQDREQEVKVWIW